MLSRFSSSIGLIKNRAEQEGLSTPREGQEFWDNYIGEEYSLPQQYDSNLLDSNYCINQYITLWTLYQIDKELDQIEYEGITAKRAASLMGDCSALIMSSSSTHIGIDDGFSYHKKYVLSQEPFLLAKSMSDISQALESISKLSLPGAINSILPKYDEVNARSCCKYIRSGISVVKLFHILIILQTSPYYSDGIHQIAKLIIKSLREILYNKRVMNVTVDADTRGFNSKFHKSTRLKILFAMNNSDRYCIRLDFPHEGVDCIHLNLNEPPRDKATGVPFGNDEFEEAKRICGNEETFDRLFYMCDDLYWFRSDFASKIKEIGKTNEKQAWALNNFFYDRAHIELLASCDENKKAVSEFSEAFAEALAESGFSFNYDSTDTDDTPLYRYLLLYDAIFSIVSKLWVVEINSGFGKSSPYIDSVLSEQELNLLDEETKKGLFKRIKKTFSDDKILLSYIDQDLSLVDFFSKSLDRIDEMGL